MADKGIQVIDRAFEILEILSGEKEGLGVTEIGNRLALHKSTVHRIVTAMAEKGYIEKVPNKAVYKIGLKLVELSSVYLNSVELKTEARPFLWELTSKYSQASHLAILDGVDAVYIDKVDVMDNMRLYSQIGKRIPIHCSALGKCLISGLSDREIFERMSDYNFIKYTAKTVTDSNEFLRQINEVRKRGYAIDDEEHDEGIRCVAAPVYDYRDKIIAAVSVSGDSNVICRQKDQEIGAFIKEISFKISKRLGYKI